MLRCQNCGCLIDNNQTDECPYCRYDGLEEVSRCRVCGEYHPSRDMINTDFCEDCYLNNQKLEVMQRFAESEERIEDFYIDYLMSERKELTRILKNWFDSLPEKERVELLRDYVAECKDCFGEWLADE